MRYVFGPHSVQIVSSRWTCVSTSVIILAGHETTANTLSWMLLELSRNPEVQTKLRHEIQAMEYTIRSRGDSEFRASDFDAMPYLSAVLKVNGNWWISVFSHSWWHVQETLRYHPVVHNTFREAIKDDLLPLSKPIITSSGKIISEIPVPKGLKIITSIGGYNRFSWNFRYLSTIKRLSQAISETRTYLVRMPIRLIRNAGCIME